MPKMRVVQVARKNGPFEMVERDLPQPGPVKCASKCRHAASAIATLIAMQGLLPTVPYPIVPGHEIAGVIDAVGTASSDGRSARASGLAGSAAIAADASHAAGAISSIAATCAFPASPTMADMRKRWWHQPTRWRGSRTTSPGEAAPLMCAGVTTYNALRESGRVAGDLVAILGIGGLGHLGVQFAAKMGFRTVAIARGRDKETLARQLGAHIYMDSQSQDVAAELMRLGGAKTILATVTSGKAMSAVIPGLAVRGKLIVIGVGMDPIQVSAFDLIGASRSVVGHASGASIDSQDTLAFSALAGVRPTIETMPLEQAAEAYDKMMRNEARFRMVLTTGL